MMTTTLPAPRACWLLAIVAGLLLSPPALSENSDRSETGLRIVRDLPYTRSENPRQRLDLLLPASTPEGKLLPVLVYIHGGAWRSGDRAKGHRRLRHFVQTGEVAGVSVGYRLSQEAVWPAQLEDLRSALRWIRTHGKEHGLDGRRIAVWGSSAGGHLAAMLGVTEGDADPGGPGSQKEDRSIRCVIDFFGPTDFLRMNDVPGKIDHDAPDSPESRLVGGPIQEHPERVRSANPIEFVDASDPPFLIVHGTEDRLVLYGQSELLHRKLREVGVASTLIPIEGAGHGFPDRLVHERMREFLKTHLLSDSEPEKKRPVVETGRRPNVLFIAVDDLNHWVGHLGRNPRTITPNLDRLASRGVSFARAYCAAPACNPSRAALMSGRRPSTTGIYLNSHPYRPHIPPEQTLNSHFRANGYHVSGAGKIYHGGGGRLEEWDEYAQRPRLEPAKALEKGGVGRLAWARLEGGDDVLADHHTVSYCIEQLGKERDQPFFLACGIFRPHLPWNVPEKYFALHPLESIELPPYREDDLEDLPPAGRRMARPQGDHRAVRAAKQWKPLIRAYLASVSFADAQLGRLLDALDRSAHRENTIVVLWGDHGWHLGEKHHWRKFALWEEATRAPLIWVVPGVTPRGEISPRPVDFLSIYPTLCELTGLDQPAHLDGTSIVPLLKDPDATWERPALTTYGFRNHAIRTEHHRYIRYANGDVELYDHRVDPHEWTNLAGRSEQAELEKSLARWLPAEDHPAVKSARRGRANRPTKSRNER